MSLAALIQPNVVEMVEAAALLCPISYLDHLTAPLVLRMVALHLDEVCFVSYSWDCIGGTVPGGNDLIISFPTDGRCHGHSSIEF